MNVLLIGGTGVLSSAITKQAQKNNYHITMINRGRRSIPDGVDVIKSDCANYNFIESQLEGKFFDAVIDFLCYTDDATKKSFNLYSKYTKQYFFISSCAVYDKTYPGVKNEESPKGLKIWSYSTNKWASEQLILKLAEKSNCKYTIIRPCVTYDDTRIPYGIMPPYGFHWTWCARILSGKPVVRWNQGVTKSNMMRVEDFAIGVIGLIGNPLAYNPAFNVCGGETPSFNDVLDVVENNLGKKAVIVDVTSEFYAQEIPSRRGEILGGRSIDAINSNEKIKKIVPEFKQTITLVDGVAQTILAYKNRNYQKGIDWKFDGDTDRIIRKWCKVNKISPKQYNLGFVDYLNNATFRNYLTYKLEFYKDIFFVRVVCLVCSASYKILGRSKRILKRIMK